MRIKQKKRRLTLENLENRELMAIDIALHRGVLTVTGTSQSDVVEVRQIGSEIVVNTQTGEEDVTRRFSRARVRAIAISTGGGDDVVRNETSLPSKISGGSGNDLLIGGIAQDVIAGGNGDDVIYGGRGNDDLRGNNGNDRIYGEEGKDTLRGDSGNDLLVGNSGDDSLYGGTGRDRIVGNTPRVGNSELVSNPHSGQVHTRGDGAATSSLQQAIEAAIVAWEEAGASKEQLAAIDAAEILVADLPGNRLGMVTAAGDSVTIWIDNDAAGGGWRTAEITVPENPFGEIDLVGVLAHEFGHAMGLRDSNEVASVMHEQYSDERTRPSPSDGAALPAPDQVQNLAMENLTAFESILGTRIGNTSFSTLTYNSLATMYLYSRIRNPFTSFYSRMTGLLGRGWY